MLLLGTNGTVHWSPQSAQVTVVSSLSLSLEFLKERDGLSLEEELELGYFLSECFDLYRSIL